MSSSSRTLPLVWGALGVLACSAPGQTRSSAITDAGFVLDPRGTSANCSDPAAGADGADATSGAGPASVAICTPTRHRDFATEIQPLFSACAGEVCHDFTTAGLLATIGLPSLECCGQKSLIVAGAPGQSYLLDKLRGEHLCGGVRMPMDKPPLSDGDIQAISDWVCEGAPNSP